VRQAIAAAQRNSTGVLADYRALARIERHENYERTTHTRGTPDELLAEPSADEWI